MAKPAKHMTKKELEFELKSCRMNKSTEAFTSLGKQLTGWIGICFCAYWAFRAIEVLADKTTITSIVIDVLGKVEISIVFTFSAGIFGLLYGLRQRKLRKNTVERLQQRIGMLETQLDINRSSSLLTVRGDSRPEDVL
jgi:hypothetical protein